MEAHQRQIQESIEKCKLAVDSGTQLYRVSPEFAKKTWMVFVFDLFHINFNKSSSSPEK